MQKQWKEAHVGDAVDRDSLEVVLVELLNSGLKVGGGLVLDETLAAGAGSVTLAVDLTVDNVKTGLTCEIFQVLNSELASELDVEKVNAAMIKACLIALLAKGPRARYVPASWSRTEAR